MDPHNKVNQNLKNETHSYKSVVSYFCPDTSLKEYNQDVPWTESEQNLYKPQDPFKAIHLFLKKYKEFLSNP